ncbi:hypothetical protein, partial [Streptomyces sp. NPDC057417]|uniref:hypothetical protein n=1 Tax=Streptomyces sp. NPDC057417 TaxID=3346125 RepID=UPI0036BA30D5
AGSHPRAPAAPGPPAAGAPRPAAALDRLTAAQRAQVEHVFAEEHLALTRASWQHTARRSAELRAEYEAAYRTLRARLLAGLLPAGALVVAVDLVVLASGWPS